MNSAEFETIEQEMNSIRQLATAEPREAIRSRLYQILGHCYLALAMTEGWSGMQPLPKTMIEDLSGLSRRTLKAIGRKNIKSIQDLVAFYKEHLSVGPVRGITPQSKREIRRVLLNERLIES